MNYNYFKSLLSFKKLSVIETEEEIKEKVFEFSCWEIPIFGDAYFYKVTAKNKDEAFKELVKYFYGDNYFSDKIKSETKIVSYPQKDIFVCKNMPSWFAKIIGGSRRNPETGENYRKKLEEYCLKNNIKMKEH